METVKRTQDPLQYVADLELAMPRGSFQTQGSRSPEAASVAALVADQVEQAFIADKSLMSFVAQINGQARQDVLNSVLLAQLAANKKVDIGQDVKAWYNSFVEVLRQVGWVVESQRQDKFKARKSIVEMEEVILETLTGALGAPYVVLIKKTLEALKKMKEKDSSRIRVFEENTVENEKGCMQIGAATVEADAVSLQMGTFMITSSSKIKRILFFGFDKDRTSVEYAACKATLSSELYGKVRKTIEDKLAGFVSGYVAAIDL